MKLIHKKILYFSAVASMLILGYALPIIYIVLLPLLIAVALRGLISSIFDRLALSVSLIVCLNILFGVFYWILEADYSAPAIFLMHALACTILAGYLIFGTDLVGIRRSFRLPRISLSETLSLMLSIGVFVLLFLPLLTKYNTNYIFQFFVYGGDNITHLELTKVVAENKGFLYEDVEVTKDIITSNSTAYPQGLALNMYVAREYVGSLIPIDSPKKELYSFVLMTTFFYALLSYVWIRITFTLMARIKGLSVGLQIFTFILFAVVFLGAFLHFYTNGFQTHITSLVLFGHMLWLVSLLLRKDSPHQAFALSTLFLLNIGIAFTWLFLAPVSLTVSGVLFMLTFYKQIFSRKVLQFIRNNLAMIGIILASIAICFVQVYIQLAYGIKEDSINEPGYVLHPEQSIIIVGALIPLILYAVSPKLMSSTRIASAFPIMVFTLVSALFTIMIYIYQVSTEGRPEYYYFKSAYHLILLGATALPALLLCIGTLVSKTRQLYFLTTVYVFACIAGAITIPHYLAPILNSAVSNITPEITNTYGDVINVEPKNADNVIAIGSCNRQQDFVITKLSGILGNDNTYLRQRVAFSTIANTSDRTMLIQEYQTALEQSGQKLIILDNGVEPVGVTPDITSKAVLIPVPSVPEAGNSAKCPHRFTGTLEPKLYDVREPF